MNENTIDHLEYRKKAYEALRRFLDESGYSNRKFAIEADIIPGTFQNMLNRRSIIRSDNFIKILATMYEISLGDGYSIEQGDKLKNIADDFYFWAKGADPSTSPKDLLSEEDRSAGDAIRIMNQFLHNDQFTSDLLLELEKLNSTGKKEAVKRVQELTYIPKYRKGKED